ncbi:MAG TPA: CRISPR-associated endonuclease Cas1, partial [Thermopetrobacter sp.]|nr:CRISPR-associated endonuclease Cas1 [Thermopetrobacter sp.]
IRHALATNTLVALVNGHGETLGWINETLQPRAGRHLAQARLALDEAARLDLARILVEGRLRNQRAVLRRLLAERKKSGRSRPQKALDAIVTISRLLGRGERSRIRHARAIDVLTGYEGQAGAAWWRAIGALVHPDFSFAVRRENSAAGIALDFLAWLLHRDISVAVMRAGLHPGFGALHAVSDQRDACVYDLMEEFRAQFVGGLFVHASNARILRRDMFSGSGKGIRMKSAGGTALIRAYERRAEGLVKSPRGGRRVRWRMLMMEQAQALSAHVEGGGHYQPYEMSY